MGLRAETLAVAAPAKAPPVDFERLMLAEQRRIFLLCRRLLIDDHEADSAAQDVFLKAYRALDRQSPGVVENLPGWLTRIAVNTCLDRLRSRRWRFWRRRAPAGTAERVFSSAPALAPDAEREAYAAQIRQRLEQAMGCLSERQRIIFALKHYEDRKLEEIADLLALDVGSVKSHLFRAITKLRTQLKDLYGNQTLER